MKIFKTICNICLIVLCSVSLFLDGYYIYLKFFDNKTTTGIYNVDDQIPVDLAEKKEDLTETEIEYYEARKLFNVRYYSNSANNGAEVQEMNINYFTDYTLSTSACRSTGMQYMGNYVPYTTKVDSKENANELVKPDFWYYDTTNMISWSGGKVATQLNRNQKLMIKIDDKPYQIQLTKEWTTTSGWWIFKTTTNHYSDWGDVFADVLKAVRTNSQGYGEWYITLDLSDYFTIYSFDEETKKFVEDRTTDILKNYATIKFEYFENGLKNSNQSLFGLIEGNKNYGKQTEDYDTDFWQERVVYELNSSMLNERYSDTYNGSFLSLSYDLRETFNKMPRAKVNLIIDLDNSNVVGFDYNAFENFKIDTITIKGTNKQFYLLDKSLYGTQVSTIKVSQTIELVYSENVIDTEFVEVVL